MAYKVILGVQRLGGGLPRGMLEFHLPRPPRARRHGRILALSGSGHGRRHLDGRGLEGFFSTVGVGPVGVVGTAGRRGTRHVARIRGSQWGEKTVQQSGVSRIWTEGRKKLGTEEEQRLGRGLRRERVADKERMARRWQNKREIDCQEQRARARYTGERFAAWHEDVGPDVAASPSCQTCVRLPFRPLRLHAPEGGVAASQWRAARVDEAAVLTQPGLRRRPFHKHVRCAKPGAYAASCRFVSRGGSFFSPQARFGAMGHGLPAAVREPSALHLVQKSQWVLLRWQLGGAECRHA